MSTVTIEEAQSFVDAFNEEYVQKHKAFEEQFWGTKVRVMRVWHEELQSAPDVALIAFVLYLISFFHSANR